MQNRVLVSFGVVLLGLVLWNTWSLSSLNNRLSQWEGQSTASNAVASDGNGKESVQVAGRSRLKGSASSARSDDLGTRQTASVPEAGGALDLENPEVREKIAEIMVAEETQRKEEKRTERAAMYMDSMVREIDTFASEFNLDSQTKARLIREVEVNGQAFSAVRNDVKDGKMSWFDAKEEFRAIKDEGAANLRDLLGDEQYDVLRVRLWGDRGHHN